MHRARVGLAQAHVALSHVEEARTLAREIIAYAEPRGDRRNEHFGWHFLADCALIERRFEESLLLYRKSLAMAEATGDRVEISFELQGVGMSLAGLGNADTAVRLDSAATTEWARLGVEVEVRFWRALNHEHFGAARQSLGAEATHAATAAGQAMGFEAAIALAMGGR
jgi:tetratricopeptide (TPR) repeat protein